MRNGTIYKKVAALIKKHQSRNPEILIKKLNIKLQYISSTSALLGMYRVILKNRYIFIPDNLGSLKKMVLAHEIGHDQLHRKECVNGASFHESRIFSPLNHYELEANIFAAHLLIPDEEVIEMIRYGQSDQELANRLCVDINLLNLKISEMAKMNLLDIDVSKIERPKSDFLKNYQPLDDEWSIF